VLVVGAGILGLAHAVEAIRRGLSVVVIERDDRAVGASVRNFGHVCVTGQVADQHRWALAARQRWLELAADAGFWTATGGAVVAARSDDEMSVIEDLVDSGHGDVRVLDRAGLKALVELSDDVIGGAHLPLDIRVNPREAVAAIAAWVERQPGAEIRWSTSFLGLDGDVLRTSRGAVAAGRTIVCVGHNVDRAFPDIAADAGVRRCELHMLRVANPRPTTIAPAVLSATGLLRYDAFAAQPSAAALRQRFERDHPDLLEAGLNLMFTQLPDGDLTVGDTHGYAATLPPYRDEAYDELVLRETAQLLGVRSLTVKQRWRGVYASAPATTLVADVSPTATVVAVTSGIGMTIGHGLAIDVLDRVLP
jgi:D-hydroxyproline dehydrogenase subunit beta